MAEEISKDSQLLSQLKKEESIAFNHLYGYCFPSVANYIRRSSGSDQDAEDIFQEALIVLLHKVRQPEFMLTSSLKTYLFSISKNLWLKRLRDHKLKTVDSDAGAYEYRIETITIELEPEESREERVEGWLQKITRNCRNILKAIFFYEVPMSVLMVKMGWKNKHTASNQKHKCMQQIKKYKR